LNRTYKNKKPIIDELTRKLEEIEAKFVTYNTHTKNDGVNYWRGKPIISLDDWLELSSFGEAFAKGGQVRNMNKSLQYFPDDLFSWTLFPGGVQEEYVDATNRWYLQYMELMFYRKNPKLHAKSYEEWLELKKQSMKEKEEDERRRKAEGKDGVWNNWGFK
jgi:hypothetical protein